MARTRKAEFKEMEFRYEFQREYCNARIRCRGRNDEERKNDGKKIICNLLNANPEDVRFIRARA